MTTNTAHAEAIKGEFAQLIQQAFRISSELGEDLEQELASEPIENLTPDQAYSILSKAIERIQRRAMEEGDTPVAESLAGPVSRLVNRIIESQRRIANPVSEAISREISLSTHNGISPRAVLPNPVFHGVSVPVMEGYVKSREINLWDQNERLEIHVAQFRKKWGRGPDPEELLHIMLSELSLPGTPTGTMSDEFEIKSLARSIATNGVRVRPILDVDGTPLDGNRRLTACYYILNSPEFTAEEKRSVEFIKVWQLTEHALPEHREAVVVSLNFEDDHKKPWPTYIKARKVYDEYQQRLDLESNATERRKSDIRKEIAQKFAIDRRTVDRYITMVSWADEFEEHQVAERGRDEFAVKHRANEAFEYFDELSKGKNPGGVAHTLNQNPDVKHLAFDLLFQGRFKNWRQIRDLKYVPGSDDALKYLQKAREEPDEETAEEYVENAISVARTAKAGTRELGVNTRIEAFVKFMGELPVASLTSETLVDPRNLFRLLAVMRLGEAQTKAAYGDLFDQKVEEAARTLR